MDTKHIHQGQELLSFYSHIFNELPLTKQMQLHYIKALPIIIACCRASNIYT